jgi:hypothetical protein
VAAVALASIVLGARQRGVETLVRAGDNLQAALDRARPGAIVRLEAGATFEGNFRLPRKDGAEPITIRSAADDRDLPSTTQRIGPAHARVLPVIASPNAQPALRTDPGARHWRIVAVQFVGNGGGDLIALGDGSRAQSSYDDVPDDLVLDRVLVRGDAERGQKRGVALNSASTTIRNSYIADIKAEGLETQAIAGWNGPGPYVIENNYLEAAGVNVLFGGSEPFIGGLVPGDIVFRRNLVTKNLDWRGERWNVKNLFELKNARRVLVEGNRFERNWSAAQVGFAVLFTVRNPGGRAPWSTVEDVTFRDNLVRHVGGGINVLGYDTNARSQQVRGILIRNNLFDDVNHHEWGGNGTFLQLGDEPADVAVEHNTVFQTGNVVTVYGGTRTQPRQVNGFRLTDNIALHNSFGIFGSGQGVGTPAIDRYFPSAQIAGNVLAGGLAARYPPGNFFPTAQELTEQFVDHDRHDYRLIPASWLRSAATDGGAVGVDLDTLATALGGSGR